MPNYNMNNSKNNFRRESQFSSKLRCSFYTRDGRCIRNAARHSIYCWIHHERVMQSSVPHQNDIEKSTSNELEKVILLTEPIESVQIETIAIEEPKLKPNLDEQKPRPALEITTTSLPETTPIVEPAIEEAKIPIEEKVSSGCVIC